MPEVHDPNGGNMFRSRRGRKRKVAKAAAADSKAKINSSPSQSRLSRIQLPTQRLRRATSPKDPLDFGGDSDGETSVDNVAASRKSPPEDRKGTQRKLKFASLANGEAAKKPRSKKQRKNDELHKLSGASSSSPLAPKRGETDSTTVSEPSVAKGRENFDSTYPSSRYAIAIDTRCLNNRAGKDDQEDFSARVKDFLQTIFRQRGFSPSLVTWTECCSSNTTPSPSKKRKVRALLKSNENDIETTILSEPIQDNNSTNKILSKVKECPIQSLKSDEKDIDDDKMETHLPNGLQAKATWNVFGDLVDGSVDCDGTFCYTQTPLKVVLFTSTATIGLDANSTNHIRGIDDFWETSRCHFSNQKVQSIDIVVVKGETVIHREQKASDGTTIKNVRDNSVNDDDDKKQVQTIASKSEGDDEDTDKECKSSDLKDDIGNQDSIMETMKRHIEKKVEEDLKQSRSRMQLDSEFAGKYSPIKISLSVVDSTVDFHSLCQRWSRESLRAATLSQHGQNIPTICFKLPETKGYDACEVLFASYYNNMPFRIDSWKARRLCTDLILLSKANLQVVQLVPISSVDASLIYGVAIGLRVEESDRENISLVQSLFQLMEERECALLLCSTRDSSIDETNGRRRIARDDDDGLFHSAEESQYFLFMPQFVVSKDGPAASKTGVLHRITNANHILEETDKLDQANPLHSGAKKNSYSGYLKECLDSLKCSTVNPYRLSGA